MSHDSAEPSPIYNGTNTIVNNMLTSVPEMTTFEIIFCSPKFISPRTAKTLLNPIINGKNERIFRIRIDCIYSGPKTTDTILSAKINNVKDTTKVAGPIIYIIFFRNTIAFDFDSDANLLICG